MKLDAISTLGGRRAVLFVFVAVAVFWWPATKFQLLNYDDGEYVFENTAIRDGLTVDGVKWAFNCGYAANWHPLAWISGMLDVSLARTAEKAGFVRRGKPLHPSWVLDCDEAALAWTMHLHNILLHASNAALLFLLALAMVRRISADAGAVTDGQEVTPRLLAAAMAILWAVHPLRCEAVCWVSERKELLSVFFMLLALLFWIKNQTPKLFYPLSLLAFSLALMAKPVAVTLPTVMFAWDWMVCRRRFREALVRVLPFVALAVATCLLTLVAQREAMPTIKDLPVPVRVSCVLKAPVVYLFQTVFPYGLSSCYRIPWQVEWGWAAAGVVLLVALAAICVVWIATHGKVAATAVFGVVWVYGGLLPMLGIVKVGNQPHSDRYTYWVGCGAAVLLTAALQWLHRRISSLRLGEEDKRRLGRVLARLLLAVVLAYGACGFVRMFVWHDSLLLFRDGYEKSHEPEEALLYATNLIPEGRYAEAEDVMRDAVSREKNAKSFGMLALVLSQKEKVLSLDEATYLAETALKADPKVGEAHAAMGNIKLRFGQTEEAVRHYEDAVKNGFKDQLVTQLLADHRAGKPIGLEAMMKRAREIGKDQKR